MERRVLTLRENDAVELCNVERQLLVCGHTEKGRLSLSNVPATRGEVFRDITRSGADEAQLQLLLSRMSLSSHTCLSTMLHPRNIECRLNLKKLKEKEKEKGKKKERVHLVKNALNESERERTLAEVGDGAAKHWCPDLQRKRLGTGPAKLSPLLREVWGQREHLRGFL